MSEKKKQNKKRFTLLPNIKMKKLLATLGLAGMLAGSPSVNAQIDSTRSKTNEDLVEVVTQDQETSQDDGKTISFEKAKELNDIDKMVESLMGLDVVQDLLKIYDENYIRGILKEEVSESINKLRGGEYSDEYIDQTIVYVVENIDIFNEDLDRIIQESVDDPEFQESMKNGDEETMIRIIKHKPEEIHANNVKMRWLRKSLILFGVILIVASYICGIRIYGIRKQKK